MTSSPGRTPAASSARCSALVPELVPMACRVRQCPANSISKAATSGPRTNRPLSMTRTNAASTRGLRLWYCARRSISGICIPIQLDESAAIRQRAGGGLQDAHHAIPGPAIRDGPAALPHAVHEVSRLGAERLRQPQPGGPHVAGAVAYQHLEAASLAGFERDALVVDLQLL